MSSPGRIVIVGAGSAGCALAARLSENPDREVVLIEEGDWFTPSTGLSTLRGQGSLALAFDPERSRSWVVDTGSRSVDLRGGKGVGGSSAVNGCYFVRAHERDLTDWASVAGPDYSPSAFSGLYAKTETDLDFGGTAGHGNSGPVPVKRDSTALHPVSEAFLAEARGRGASYEPDLNRPDTGHVAQAHGRGGDGSLRAVIGPVPFNSRDGLRADMATCYLGETPSGESRHNLKVMTRVRTARVVLRDGAATGVEVVRGGERVVIRADQVVLCAGAFGSPALLFASGIGPANMLRAAGVKPLVDLPGVGASLFNHPTIDLGYAPRSRVLGDGDRESAATNFMQLALYTSAGPTTHASAGPGIVEIMATRRPYGSATSLDPGDATLSFRVTLMDPIGRGTLRPAPGGAASDQSGLTIAHDPLATGRDRAVARSAVRLADEFLRSARFEPLVASRFGPSVDQIGSDDQLDLWLRDSVTFAFHQMGTCAMGAMDSPESVVDPRFRVRGVDRLAVVDASVIPVPLTRGPAATVVALAELAAGVLAGE